MDSVRFPGKVLADRTGKPLVQHVYEQARQARLIHRVIVAGDDDRIRVAVEAFGGEYAHTRRDHPNGTSRIAEVAERLTAPIIVNVQGDEPEMDPAIIDLGVQTLINHPECPMATIASSFGPDEDATSPNMVKVVMNQRGHAMYFSRSVIPFDRDGSGQSPPLKHVGLYIYRREFLKQYAALSPTPMEESEKLEQLRVVEHGFPIALAVAQAYNCGIDTPEQYEMFVSRHRQRSAAHA